MACVKHLLAVASVTALAVAIGGCDEPESDGSKDGGAEDDGGAGEEEGGGGRRAVRNWACQVDTLTSFEDDCFCQASPLSVELMPTFGVEVPHCVEHNCCLLTQQDAWDTDASCECFDSSGSCEGEAASRRGVVAVDQCPPSEEDRTPEPEFARDGENCAPDYLASNGLAGCGETSICAQNSDGVRVCQEATDAQLEAYAACEEEVQDDTYGGLPKQVSGQLVVAGTHALEFGSVEFDLNSFGAGACFPTLGLTFGDLYGPTECGLSVDAGPELNDDGSLRVNRVVLSVDGCPIEGVTRGFFLSETPEDVSGGVTFEGVTCDRGLIFEDYCIAGTYRVRLSGSFVNDLLPSEEPETILSFEEGHELVVEGADCYASYDENIVCP